MTCHNAENDMYKLEKPLVGNVNVWLPSIN